MLPSRVEYSSWSGPARAMAVAVDAAVAAARAGEADDFDATLGQLERLDRAQLRVLLGAVTRDLIERRLPDGLDADDAADLLQSAERAIAWYPRADHTALAVALTSALGVVDPDELPALDDLAVLAHGTLLIADLLGSGPLEPLVDTAMRELHRAQTVEMP